ncbi:MAG: glycosyltransferase [Thermoplasmata archaeon]|nr:MAG: glycosyltransferase [Thermoplasmata archaeon]
MRVLYGICSWGLGHATRSLPIIRKLIDEGDEVTLISTGRSLELLNMELGDSAEYWDFPDYPLPYTERSKVFIIKFCFFAPRLVTSVISEHKKLVKLIDEKKFDIIISDNRYGVFHRNIPSFFITHQLRVISPARIKLVENNFERFTFYFRTRFKKFMVPDYEENGISGDLSHDLNLHNSDKVEYIGILSDFKNMHVDEDVDLLFSISGPEPQRQILENLIFQQINDIDGRIILSLGRNLNGKVEEFKKTLNDNIQIYDFLPREERELIMNRSKFIVSRPGYSTLMDIYGLGKKAMFIPTPQQTEQEYLAKYHEEMGNFHYIYQDDLNLKRDLERAGQYSGPDRRYDVEKSVKRFMDVIHS